MALPQHQWGILLDPPLHFHGGSGLTAAARWINHHDKDVDGVMRATEVVATNDERGGRRRQGEGIGGGTWSL